MQYKLYYLECVYTLYCNDKLSIVYYKQKYIYTSIL